MDFVAKRKLQGTNMNWYILQQLPDITRAAYDRADWRHHRRRPGPRTTSCRLCYTAWDLQGFAQAPASPPCPLPTTTTANPSPGTPSSAATSAPASSPLLPPLRPRPRRRRYVLDSFPITRRNDERNHQGRYLTKDLILAYLSALSAGDTETVVNI